MIWRFDAIWRFLNFVDSPRAEGFARAEGSKIAAYPRFSIWYLVTNINQNLATNIYDIS